MENISITNTNITETNFSWKEVTKEEYSKILNDEKIIFSQMIPKNDFLIENDDFVFDGDGKPLLVEQENELTPLVVPKENQFFYLNGKDNRLDVFVYDSYQDVYEIDSSFLKENNTDFKPILFFEDGKYQGMVWVSYYNDYIGMYGFRSSLANTILRVKGFSKKALDVLESTGKKLVALNPLETFSKILEKRGYHYHKDSKFTSNFYTNDYGNPNYYSKE